MKKALIFVFAAALATSAFAQGNSDVELNKGNGNARVNNEAGGAHSSEIATPLCAAVRKMVLRPRESIAHSAPDPPVWSVFTVALITGVPQSAWLLPALSRCRLH